MIGPEPERTFRDLIDWTTRARVLRQQIERHPEPPDMALRLAEVLDAEALYLIDPLLTSAKGAGPDVLNGTLEALSDDAAPFDTLPEPAPGRPDSDALPGHPRQQAACARRRGTRSRAGGSQLARPPTRAARHGIGLGWPRSRRAIRWRCQRRW
jgi:hypothetical protein